MRQTFYYLKEMASCNSLLSEEQFLCPICLDVFTRPVSTPCGHNFCMPCISSYWDDSVVCQCPVCKEAFQRRPDLKVNTFISELASQFMSLQVNDAHMWEPVQQQTSEGEVLCDICTDTRQTAVKSCLECLTSYCGDHLEPHHRAAGLKRHTLVEPVSSLENRICKKHARPLTRVCRTDNVVLCDICSSSAKHNNHNDITVQQAYEEAMATREEAKGEMQRLIKERLQKVLDMKEAIDKSKTETKDVIAESVQELTELVSEIQQSQTELVQVIEERQKAAEEQANAFSLSMEREITKLQSTVTKMSELRGTEDYLDFLVSMQEMSLLHPTMNSLTFSFDRRVDIHRTRKCLGKALSQVRKLLEEMNREMKELFSGTDLEDNTMLRCYIVDIFLDPDTAHPQLVVSDDRRQVRYNMGSAQSENPTLNASAFNAHYAVLGNTALSTYKFYFEVFVGGKSEWCLGLVKESIERNGVIPRRPGCGLWAIWFLDGRFETFCNPNVPIHHGQVERVGVFVRYESDCIHFYNVETATAIYEFTNCSFTEKLYPYLNPCDNEYGSNLDPMIIVPVIKSKG
ncbi:E3 ubiquitin-protein ligase TRIM21 isoform X1 [Labrus bergylta]